MISHFFMDSREIFDKELELSLALAEKILIKTQEWLKENPKATSRMAKLFPKCKCHLKPVPLKPVPKNPFTVPYAYETLISPTLVDETEFQWNLNVPCEVQTYNNVLQTVHSKVYVEQSQVKYVHPGCFRPSSPGLLFDDLRVQDVTEDPWADFPTFVPRSQGV